MHTQRHNQHVSNNTNIQRALTLLETVVITALAALTLAAMATTLQAAKNQSRSQVCLTNLKALGNAIYTYAAEYNNTLPGPAYPALNHHQALSEYWRHGYSTNSAQFEINRRLTTLLSNVQGNNRTDQQITCPTMAAIVPDQHFDLYSEYNPYQLVSPAHYTLNNVNTNTVEAGAPSGATAYYRTTNPASYFGYSPYAGSPFPPTTPAATAAIANASREWMIADAWYRPRTNAAAPFLQHEGPYQWDNSGQALPNFAPHRRRMGQLFIYVDRDTRRCESSKIRAAKTDGLTNSLFFDGHAAPIASRTAGISGFELLYGFPGTVNPYLSRPNYENIWNRLIWD